MGSGSRFKFYRNDEFGIGFGVSRFPFAVRGIPSRIAEVRLVMGAFSFP